MSKWWKNIAWHDNQLQVLIWLVFPIVISIPALSKYSIHQALWIIAATLIYLYWVIFGHFRFALKYFIGKEKNSFKYLVRLVGVIGMGILLHGLLGLQLYAIIGEEEYNPWNHPWAFIVWTGIECILLILFSSMVKFSFDYFKLQSQQQQMENQRLEAELKYLKLQISPHFLFNTLNNLLLLTNKQSPQASRVVEKLAYMMRYLLDKDRKKEVPLYTEIEFINAYIDLERIRIKNIDISFDIEGELQRHRIPPALLIILVENAFKHGINKAVEDNFVHIELKACPTKIFFQVTNPLHGNSSHGANSHSIGLENLQKRLQLLFPDHHQLQVGPKNHHIFEATLCIHNQPDAL